MYGFAEVKRGLENTAALERELARRYFSLMNHSGYNDAGVDVLEADWDNMVILDACRYDEFRDRASLSGSLESRISRASATKEFVTANFAGRRRLDTVYVSANLWYPKLAHDIDASLRAFRPVPESSSHRNDDHVVVEPDLVTEVARRVDDEFPNKRLIVHYSQPHYPYLGETGQEYFGMDDTPNLTEAVRRANQWDSPAVVREAYRENLDLGLGAVADLLQQLVGKTVVTADHGELLGERLVPGGSRQYGHPEGIYVDPLVKVPWLVTTTGERKAVKTDATTERVEIDSSFVDAQLQHLGYKV